MLISEVTEEYTTNWEARNLGVKWTGSERRIMTTCKLHGSSSGSKLENSHLGHYSFLRIFLPWRSTSPGVEVAEDITVKAAEIVDSLDDDADEHESTTQVAIPEMMTNQRLI
ncbi:hypothetical protein E4U35_001474 [Claviceps purpurea]|nr:hypothetical protein E4U35_001474 [Claviceps purpurea]